MASRAFFVVLILCSVTTSWSISGEDIPQDKIIKPTYPKKYLPMNLDKYRFSTENIISTTTEETSTVANNSVNEEEVEVKNEDIKGSSKEFFEAMKQAMGNEDDTIPKLVTDRSKKSATTTFCVEIRPSNPYQKPFQVCEPAQQQPQLYQPYKPPQQPHRPYPPHQPMQPPQPYYPQPPQPPAQQPVMVLPHVPVAEPYHVPKPYPAGGGYRSSGGWGAEAEAWDNQWDGVEGRSSYGGGYGYDDDKVPLFDMHKRKEVKYVPLVTHTYSKTKPLKFLKVLKDLKKDKYGIEDDYYMPQRDYNPSHYGPQSQGQDYGSPSHDYGSSSSSHDSHSSSHGLVITCQPSAVGYTGQQDQATLHKHMQLLQGLYSQSEKLYNQQQLNPMQDNAGGMAGIGGSSGGYVSPGTYRDAGWKGVDGIGDEMVKAPAAEWTKAPLSSSPPASPSPSAEPTARAHFTSTHHGGAHGGSHGNKYIEDPRSSGGTHAMDPSVSSSYGGGGGSSHSGGSSGPYGAEPSMRNSGYGGGHGGSSHSGGTYGAEPQMRSSGYGGGGGSSGGSGGGYGGGGYGLEQGRSAYGAGHGHGGSGHGSGGQYGLEEVAIPANGASQAQIETAKAFIEGQKAMQLSMQNS